MTNLALIDSDEVAEWPLTRERIADIMASANGAANVTVTLPRNLDGLDLSEFGILPVAATDRPAVLPGQQTVEAAPELSDGVWTQQWAVEGDLDAVKAALLDQLADRRWQAEEAGTTVGAMPLATDRVSQGKLTAAYLKASEDAEYTIANWKVAPGVFVTLDTAAIMTAGDAMRTHVQACFDNEAALSATILAAEDFGALAAIDLETGWPE